MTIDAEMEQHLPLVYRVAQTLSGSEAVRSCRGEALISGGLQGLHRALELFDPQKGYAFATYAWPWIRGAALREAKRTAPLREFHAAIEHDIPVSEARVHEEDQEEAQALVRSLPPRHRLLVERLFFDGVRQRDVAGEMGLSRARVGQLLTEALQAMRGTIEGIENPQAVLSVAANPNQAVEKRAESVEMGSESSDSDAFSDARMSTAGA